MADIFLNLTTQSLSSSTEIQPLISPLFAPAPQLVSDATLSPFDDPSPVAAETQPSSMLPGEVADNEMVDTWKMETLSRENISTIRQPALPNLVPSDVPEQAISTLSIRRLLHTQHTARKDMELVTPGSQLSAIAPDEALMEDTSVDVDVSRPASVQRPMPTPAQETSPSHTAVEREEHGEYNALPSRPLPTGRPTSPILPTIQPLSPVLSASLQSPQLSSPPELTTKTDAPQQHVSPMPMQRATIAPEQHSVVLPQPIDRARTSVVHPLHIEYGEQHRSVTGRLFIDASESIVQPVVTPDATDITRTSVPSKALPIQNAQSAIARQGNQTTQVTAVNNRSSKSEASTPPVEPAERGLMPVVPSQLEGVHSTTGFTMQEDRVAREELEASPVRVTIGRVVVRATPATPAVSAARKRVSRPAQSLSEYLKQRERGSR